MQSSSPDTGSTAISQSIEERVLELLGVMTLAEKIGQMNQLNAGEGYAPHYLAERLRNGEIGSVLNVVDVDVVNELQRIALEESRLGIPLLVGRDVIHGFRTVLPIPLGQAATWNPDLVRQGAAMAALEAAKSGVNWTFAPMVDISRDPRWGRIAESFGEDPHLASEMGVAMVQGFQGTDIASPGSIAACAKHFAAYGAAESGRDYGTTNVSLNELRNVYLRPFKAAVDAGATSLMTSFSDVDGVPATANDFLLQQVLRREWKFEGFVVSDWDSVRQLAVHGLTDGDESSAYEAVRAGVDMEMAGESYFHHLTKLVEDGRIEVERINELTGNILRAKFRMGLFEKPFTNPDELREYGSDEALQITKASALQSIVMLKNDRSVLPLSAETLNSVAVIGPMADAPYDQLGTWVFDGDAGLSITPLTAIRDLVGENVDVRHVPAMETTRSKSIGLDAARDAAENSDAVVLILGEESILSGEAHSRADISLPGAQAELVAEIRQTGKPVIAVILAGRPLTLTNIVDNADAILFAWHPGSMGGPAIADLLFGIESPSGKLPATFPRVVGQIPLYYSQKNTGKPPSPDTVVHIDDIDALAPQTSLGMTAFHLDVDYRPLFPFGYGLSYTEFSYSDIRTSAVQIGHGDTLLISADLTNCGGVVAEEVAQFYVRDLVGNVTRPVRELKDFKRVRLNPGETIRVTFELHTDALAFFGRDMKLMTESGDFHAWIGGNSEADLRAEFRIIDRD